MKNNDKLFIAKVKANKTAISGITRDYKLVLNIYALDVAEAKEKVEKYIESKSIKLEITHKLIDVEFSEPLAQRSEKL